MIQINNKLRIVKNDDKNLVIEELRTIESEKKGTHEEWCWCGIFEANDENNWHPGNEYDNSDFRNVKRLPICPLIVLEEIENE